MPRLVATATIQTVSDYATVRSAVTDYARAFVAARRNATPKVSYAKIAAELDCSDTWVKYLANPKKYGERYVGPEIEHKLAELLHGGSIDGLRRAALHRSQGGGVLVETTAGVVDAGAAPKRRADQAPTIRRAAK